MTKTCHEPSPPARTHGRRGKDDTPGRKLTNGQLSLVLAIQSSFGRGWDPRTILDFYQYGDNLFTDEGLYNKALRPSGWHEAKSWSTWKLEAESLHVVQHGPLFLGSHQIRNQIIKSTRSLDCPSPRGPQTLACVHFPSFHRGKLDDYRNQLVNW